MSSVVLRLAVAVGLLLATRPAAASPDLWEALRQPGTVAVMRHALAPGYGDPPGFTLGDCSTQRDLDSRGRAQASAVGDAFRAAGVTVDLILSSRWCRCLHTAEETGLAPVEAFAALDSFFADRSTADRQTDEVRRRLAAADPGRKLLLITHQVNISALAGRSTRSGEVVVIRVAADGAVTALGSIAIPVP